MVYNYFSKFYPPKLNNTFLERKHILNLFDKAYEKGNIFVNAGIFYGKTSTTYCWLNKRKKIFSWLCLDKLDNNLSVFCQNLSMSICNTQDDSKLIDLFYSMDFNNNSFNNLLNIIYESNIEKEMIIVLDDFHNLISKSIIFYISLLNKRLPLNWKLIIISQEKPMNEMYEFIQKYFYCICQEEFIFSAQEIDALFRLNNQYISNVQLTKVSEISNGWIFPIIKSIEFYNYKSESVDLIKVKSYFNKFFEELIWNKLSVTDKKFLLSTCIMSIVKIEDFNFILDVNNSVHFINYFYNLNLYAFYFESNNILKYNYLFRNFLLEQMEYSDLINKKNLYKKYADWLLNEGKIIESIELYIKIDDFNKVFLVLLQFPFNIKDFINIILIHTKNSVNNNSPFTTYLSIVNFINGDIISHCSCNRNHQAPIHNSNLFFKDSTFLYFYLLDKVISPDISPWDMIKILKSSKTAAYKLPKHTNLLMLTQSMPSLLRGIKDYSIIVTNPNEFVNTFKPVSNYLFAEWSNILEHILLAEAFYQKNELEISFSYLQKIINDNGNNLLPEISFIIYCQLSLIYLAWNQLSYGEEALKKLKNILEINNAFYLLESYKAFYINFNINSKIYYDSTISLSSYYPINKNFSIKFYQIHIHISASKELASAKRFKESFDYLEKIKNFLISYNRNLDLIQVYILQAICHSKMENSIESETFKILLNAIILGQKHEFYRIFLDEPDSFKLLSDFLNKAPIYMLIGYKKTYINKILSLFRKQSKTFICIDRKMEQIVLSPMQNEMLKYLAKDMTYNEICEQTGLKITTIRTHISQLYQKLEVCNKTTALIKAKELGVFN